MGVSEETEGRVGGERAGECEWRWEECEWRDRVCKRERKGV